MKKNKLITKSELTEFLLYTSPDGEIKVEAFLRNETIWLTQKRMAELFCVGISAVSKHLQNIFESGELDEKAVVSILEIPTPHGAIKDKTQQHKTKFYNLDTVLSVGYRVNSRQATQFRIWATKVLKQYLLDGYTINKKRIGQNYEKFMQAVADVKALLPTGNKVKTEDVLDLISAFAGTWFSLEAYDKDAFPKIDASKKKVSLTAEDLLRTLSELKKDLIAKKQATEIFGQERSKKAIEGIIGNIFQSVFGKDVYPSIEEKAAQLLYFMVKNHPFVDGNKRSGAFAFIWFLCKAGLLRASLTPEALTALTLLIAESSPKDKDKMIGLVLLLLNKK